MKFLRLFFLLVLPVYMMSCGSQRKTPNYVENLADTSGIDVKIPEMRIQKNDLLSIQVYSASTQKEVSDAAYNLPTQAGSMGGFLVDAHGNIEYPAIGVLHAEGLTKLQLADIIKKKINEKDTVLTDPSVIIRFLNFKITVLGPVGREGQLSIQGERLTILEAIGLVGGVTDFGKKTNIKIIRELDGKRQVGYIDLSSKDIFESPFYNLMQNDVLIVEPTKQKQRLAEQNIVAQRISLSLSIITAAAFLYNIFK
jgi:polysaccharide export outer membrane protein